MEIEIEPKEKKESHIIFIHLWDHLSHSLRKEINVSLRKVAIINPHMYQIPNTFKIFWSPPSHSKQTTVVNIGKALNVTPNASYTLFNFIFLFKICKITAFSIGKSHTYTHTKKIAKVEKMGKNLRLKNKWHVSIISLHNRDKMNNTRSSHCGSAGMNMPSIHEDVFLMPGLVQWVKNPTLP